MAAFQLFLLHLLLSTFTDHVWGYKRGAPFSTCLTMFPKHGDTETQVGPSPFRISVDPQTYTPGNDTNITVEIKSDSERRLKGFIIRAAMASGDREISIGRFVKGERNLTKIFTCEGSYKSAVTHTEQLADEGAQVIVLTWKPPTNYTVDIVFMATVVESKPIFWTGLTATVLATRDPTKPYVVKSLHPMPETSNKPEHGLDLSTCGETKGCFLYPRYCSGSNCVAAATFRLHDNNTFLFELMAVNSSYVSLGFSYDRIMGNDETVTCTAADTGLLSVQHGYNPGRSNFRIVSHQLTAREVSRMDTDITCSFLRPRVTVTRQVNQSAPSLQYTTKEWDLSNDFFLMLAWGTVKNGSDVMNKHPTLPPVTDTMVSFQTYEIYRGSALPIYVQIHAALMVVVWMMLVGVSTAMSRYYRHWLPAHIVCNTRIWFQIHRGVGAVAGLLVICSIIIIFCYVGGFVDVRDRGRVIHASLGLTVVLILAIQITAGFIRPGPKSDWRPYFKWGHSILGQVAHILSAVTMFRAFYISYMPAAIYSFGCAFLTAWVSIQIAWTIVLELRRCCTIDEDDKKPKTKKEPLMQALKSADTVLLFFYCLTLLLTGLATLVAVVVF